MSLNDIVNVNITRETASVSRAGFSTLNILGINKAFTGLIKFYASLAAVLEDFRVTDLEYLAAAAAFAQSPAVTRLAISRRSTTDVATVTVATVANSTAYTCRINGVTYSFTSDSNATNIEIAAGLVAAINAGSEPVTAAAVGDGTYTLTADVAGAAFSLKLDSRQTVAFVTDEDIADDIAAISLIDDTWYGLVYTDRTQSDVEDIAAYIETVKKYFVTASADADIIDQAASTDTTSIAAVLKATGYARSAVFYHALAASQFVDAALLGVILPLDPGSYTAAFKSLGGVTVDTLTETQKTNALAKNAGIYLENGGVNITREGKSAEGEFIDIMIFIDWIQARIQEGVYALLVAQKKVPFTDAGIAAIQAEITAVLQLGVDRGGITTSPAFSVTVPLASAVSSADKAARTLSGVTFQATLTGAIHATQINGTVQV